MALRVKGGGPALRESGGFTPTSRPFAASKSIVPSVPVPDIALSVPTHREWAIVKEALRLVEKLAQRLGRFQHERTVWAGPASRV